MHPNACSSWLAVLLLTCLLYSCLPCVDSCPSALKKLVSSPAPPQGSVMEIPAMGCYSDKETDRDLPDYVGRYQKMRKHLCNSFCLQRNTKYFGMQDGEACYCGNSYGRLGRMTEVYCDIKCVGDIGESCGGRTHNSIYEVVDSIPLVLY